MSDPMTPGVPDDNGTSLSEVLAAYAASGFTGSFTATPDGRLTCDTCRTESAPDEIKMASVRRLEGASDPDDMLAVVALTCPKCGARGTTTLGFGPAASAEDGDILGALRDHRNDDQLPAHSAPGEALGDGPR